MRININGTSGQELDRQWDAVRKAAWELKTALHDAVPHPRDFQTEDHSVYAAARATHRENLKKVIEVLDYAHSIQADIQEQMEGRP